MPLKRAFIQTVVAKGEGTVELVTAVADSAVVSEAAEAMSNVNAQCTGGCGIFNCSGAASSELIMISRSETLRFKSRCLWVPLRSQPRLRSRRCDADLWRR